MNATTVLTHVDEIVYQCATLTSVGGTDDGILGHIDPACRRIRKELLVPVPADHYDAWPCGTCVQFAVKTPEGIHIAGPSIDAPERGEGGGSGPRDVCSEKQANFIRSLLDGRVHTLDAAVILADLEAGNVTGKKAKTLIDGLLKAPFKGGRELPPNAYPGKCTECSGEVEANAGFRRKVDGKWVVAHKPNECPETPAEAPTPPAPPTERAVQPSFEDGSPEVPEGYYALPSSGENDLVFYRVDRPEDGKWAGYVFVKMLIGGDREERVPGRNVKGILARIAEFGVNESMALYGREIGRCGRCHRTLTDETSRSIGIGPECRRKMGL